ncbi:Uu.00g139910.m01.CDS01 [Anthostomella pinea]|uniref:Uu.00g139910.m01.CDS01 n=1 Tax=Anthostomella pinea TaxID=933095 RepID=A0AAI8VJJ7_9PEZI|nr:Uu.00g139910.m01.CDS01 [Anthostomella pinea]
MQYALIFAGAALAHFAEAQGSKHGGCHGKHHSSVVTGTDEVAAVTAGSTPSAHAAWDPHHHPESWSATPSSSEKATSAAPSPSTYSSVVSISTTAPVSETSPSRVTPIPLVTSTSSAPTTLVTSASSAPNTLVNSTSRAPAPAPSSSSSSSAAAPSSHSSATSTSSTSAASSTGISKANLTPNGKKAGLSGFVGIQNKSGFSDLAPHMSWYSDYTANTPDAQDVMGVGMLWAAGGSACGSSETERLDTFNTLISSGVTPSIMFGFYEPDCDCPDSSEMSSTSAAIAWDSLIAPLAANGTVLGSPSMCKQKDEDFLTPFNAAISTTWDVTSIHINTPNVSEAQKDVEYYVEKYGQPVWVSEFACVNDHPTWAPCTEQSQVDSFINDVVAYFEGNDDVVAYGPSNGAGLGDVWPLTDSSGALTSSGQTYLNAIKGL